MMDSPNSTGDQFNLKWNNHTTNFIQVFAEHQNQGALVDVTLTCEGQYIKAHKLILSACSGYFQSLFQLHQNVMHPFILLNGIKFKDLKYILNFMYHGEVKVVDSDLPSVLALGESLQIKGLLSVKLRESNNDYSQTTIGPNNQSNFPLHPYVSQEIVTDLSRNANRSPVAKEPTNHKTLGMPAVTGGKNNTDEYVQNLHTSTTHHIISSKGDVNRHWRKSSNNGIVEPPLKKRISAFMNLPAEVPPLPSKTIKSIDNTYENKNSPEKNGTTNSKNKIPRPPNAFMIFANEWRKKLAVEHPDDNNKSISVRLGNMWKSLSPETKSSYYEAARKAEQEHREKYPDYNYNPNKARRKKKALRNLTNDDQSNFTIDVDPLSLVEVDEDTISLSESD